MSERGGRGQMLVLFVLVLVVLLGVAALVVDIGFKYASERRYQAVADAASLAGAQDLQPVSRQVPPTTHDYQQARAHALRIVLDQLIGDGATSGCATNRDIDDCALPGDQFRVSIRTPSPNCVDCDPERSVQVTIREPEHPVTLARIFGQDTWDLRRTSVAGLEFARSYAIVTLRPPASGRLPNVRDIVLNGDNTVARVVIGDVGTNANMEYDGVGAYLDLAPGYRMYYYPNVPPLWDQATRGPIGRPLQAFILDPDYPVPPAPGPTYRRVDEAELDAASCEALVTASVLGVPDYRDVAEELLIVDAATGLPDWTKVTCLKPGTYDVPVADGNRELTVLLPGLYYFNGGLDMQSMLVGGFDPAAGGVSLVFPEGISVFKQRSGAVILNAGSRFRNSGGAEPSTAPAMTGTEPNLKMTVIVQRDDGCVVGLPYPAPCDDNHNKALDLAGGTALYLAGVQYAPSDNSSISGSSDAQGYVGQIWAWTLTYSGGSTLNQEGVESEGPGTMRIDTACSPGEPQASCR